MPSRVIDTAVVDVVPDLQKFGPALDRQLTRVLTQLGVQVDRATDGITTDFEQASREIQRSLSNVGETAKRSFDGITTKTDLVANEMGREFQHAGEVVERSFDEIALRADRELDKVDRHATTTAAAMEKKFSLASLGVGAALFGVGTAAVAGLGALATMGLTSAASLEQVKISFDSLLGSAEKGQQVFTDLQKFAAQTPFEFPDVASAAKRFLAFAGSVGLTKDQLLDYLTTIGNVISVTGGGADSFGRISLAIGQIGSASKVTLDNLNQIADAIPGFSPIAAIAKSLGVSTADAMAQVSAGTITAQQGVAALLAGMRQFPGAAGAMEKQSHTLLGVFSTFKDTVGQALAQAFAPTIPKIKDTLDKLTPVIGDALSQVAPALGNTLAGILPLIASLVKGITPILTPILNALGPALESLGPALEPLGKALGDIIVPLTPLIPLIANFLVAALELLVPILMLLAIVLKPLTPIFEFLAKAVGEFAKWLMTIDWGAVGEAIAHGFVIAWNAVKDFFVGVGRYFAKLPGEIVAFIKNLPTLIGNFFKFMFDGILKLIGLWIGTLIFTFTKLPGMLIRALWNLNREFGAWLVQTFLDIVHKVLEVDAAIITWFEELPGKIMTAVRELPLTLAIFFASIFVKVRKIVIGAIDDIVNFFKSIPKRLAGFAAGVGSGITDFIKRFLNHAIDQINTGIAKIDEFTPGSLPRLPRLARGGIAFGPALVGEDSNTTPEAAIPLGDPHALALLRSALGTGGPQVTFEAGSININVDGSVTQKQAKQIGQTIGTAIGDTLNKTGIRTAVRMAA